MLWQDARAMWNGGRFASRYYSVNLAMCCVEHCDLVYVMSQMCSSKCQWLVLSLVSKSNKFFFCQITYQLNTGYRMECDSDRLHTVMAVCWQLCASQLHYQMCTMLSDLVETNQVGYRTEYKSALLYLRCIAVTIPFSLVHAVHVTLETLKLVVF